MFLWAPRQALMIPVSVGQMHYDGAWSSPSTYSNQRKLLTGGQVREYLPFLDISSSFSNPDRRMSSASDSAPWYPSSEGTKSLSITKLLVITVVNVALVATVFTVRIAVGGELLATS